MILKAAAIFAFTFFFFVSCKNSQRQEPLQDQTPKALQEKSASIEIYSKRGNDDLVEALYNELIEKTPELKDLENRIKNLNESSKDSSELFENYNGKNQSYFTTANTHADQVKDSVLKQKMKSLIANSLEKYNSKILAHTNLLKDIDGKKSTLSDLHQILKITRTLPMIEEYQLRNLPSTKPLEGLEREVDRTIKLADTLVKKISSDLKNEP